MVTVIMHELEPITQSGSLSDEVARRLRSAIKDGDFPPGTRLVEQEIAAQLLVSRMPVRTAIQKLIDEGLVIKEPRRGAFVHTYSARELDEVTSIRITLESMVVEFALPNWSDAAELELERIFQLMIEAARNGDRQAIIELDTAFHSLLWDLSEHSILIELVSSLRSRIGRFLAEATYAVLPPELMKHVSTHRELIDVFRGGDIVKAKAAMTGHIVASQKRIKANYAYLGQRATSNPVTEFNLPTPAGS
ncbi:MAG: GntR family transcriptional regulator [Anaerolineaceae bacterium]|nr:GntR family transcriptional regulator [Anaerolineaceae bacterium]